MSWNEFLYGFADFMYFTFELLEGVGDGANLLFLAVGFVLLIIWVRQMLVYRNEAKETGGIE